MHHILEMLARDPQKLFLYSSGVVGMDATSYGELTTPNVVSKSFPSGHDPITCDMQASTLNQQQVLLQTSTMSTLIWRI